MATPPTAPKILTVEQANRLLPEVRRLLADLRARRETLRGLENEVAVTELEGLQSDGTPSAVSQAKISTQAARLTQEMEEFQDTLRRMDALGCQLKDLDQGLVDFFTVHQGQLVYLCWKDGEEAVQFWHHLEDGFTGRRPVAELANN